MTSRLVREKLSPLDYINLAPMSRYSVISWFTFRKLRL